MFLPMLEPSPATNPRGMPPTPQPASSVQSESGEQSGQGSGRGSGQASGQQSGWLRRRRFLGFSVGVALAALGWGWLRRGPRLDPARLTANRPAGLLPGVFFSPRQQAVLQAVALRILDGAEPPPSQDGAVAQCQFIDRYVAALAKPLRDDLQALLALVEYAPLFGFAARFTRLPDAEQDAVLRHLETSRFPLLRQAFAALKSLCCLAHYQDERSFAAIGYSGPLVRG
mgnify:CR=1 FL=1